MSAGERRSAANGAIVKGEQRAAGELQQADAAGQFLDAGAQLSMFEQDGGAIRPDDERRGPGRPKGAANKLKTKIKEYMLGMGYRDPMQQLAMLSGIDRPDLHPMAYAAMIAQELGCSVMEVQREMRQATAELMPYWHAKVTPDVNAGAGAQVNIIQAAPGAQVAAVQSGASSTSQGRRMGPPPMPGESEENQEVAGSTDPDTNKDHRS